MMGKIATWLDLAMVPTQRSGESGVRVHTIENGSRRRCYALSVGERWLHGSNGELTVLHGIGSALHFLKAAGVEQFEPGDAREGGFVCGAGTCLCLDRQRRLVACPHLQQQAKTAH